MDVVQPQKTCTTLKGVFGGRSYGQTDSENGSDVQKPIDFPERHISHRALGWDATKHESHAPDRKVILTSAIVYVESVS
jgi:hypothetical protein